MAAADISAGTRQFATVTVVSESIKEILILKIVLTSNMPDETVIEKPLA